MRLAGLLSSPHAFAEPALKVAASLLRRSPTLDVQVDLENTSAADVRPLTVTGELRGDEESTELKSGLARGERERVVLHFPEAPPGTFGLALRLIYPPQPGATETVEQLQCIALRAGGEVTPPIAIHAPDLALETTAEWPLTISSTDGKPHHVQLWIEVPRGLGVSTLSLAVDVDGKTPSVRRPRLYRGKIVRGARVGAYVMAEAEGGTSVLGQGTIEILPDPALLPRLRLPLAILALLLLSAAAALEVKARFA